MELRWIQRPEYIKKDSNGDITHRGLITRVLQVYKLTGIKDVIVDGKSVRVNCTEWVDVPEINYQDVDKKGN